MKLGGHLTWSAAHPGWTVLSPCHFRARQSFESPQPCGPEHGHVGARLVIAGVKCSIRGSGGPRYPLDRLARNIVKDLSEGPLRPPAVSAWLDTPYRRVTIFRRRLYGSPPRYRTCVWLAQHYLWLLREWALEPAEEPARRCCVTRNRHVSAPERVVERRPGQEGAHPVAGHGENERLGARRAVGRGRRTCYFEHAAPEQLPGTRHPEVGGTRKGAARPRSGRRAPGETCRALPG